MLMSDLAQALDPVIFAKEALKFNPDPWQEQALRWSGKRLLLNCSRQSGKSTTAAILALHRALFYPKSLILLVSPSLRQSSELFRKVQDLFKALPSEQQPELVEDNKLSLTMKNKSRIVSLPGSEGTIRGFSGAALIIEDEAARVPDDLYFAVRPMLAVSGGRLILMSTPFGKRGHFFKEWTEGGDTWERIKITAYDCPRISHEFLEEERRSMGDWWFKQEYLCEFVETEDSVFTYDQVVTALNDDIEPLFGGGE
ncbi:terminase large subunit [Thermoanaerobacter sp. CM-CNRG TB177]|jgi:hypothetical protein|uniref:terminase large subunit domain-containing protein n=1 Tax=Thermoanaerobacter sp. CM-CNRG TB177 TaxID=2800659 RepID=UPI001BDEFF04|nr:terminase large subunit [Thermoanaerobacter sp. CM-CNRG TB177]MBT1279306.1 hypothetical protein [Thermoanaerobacter sp. CM-CNRG TB177]